MAMDLRTFGLPSRAAMEEDDDAVELSLGLSIGGRLRKVGEYGAGPLRQDLEMGSGEAGAGRRGSGASMSSSSTQLSLGFRQGDLADGHDPNRRREMHAMRRQEARKRRHEKQKKKGPACGVGEDVAAGAGFCGSSPSREETCLADDQVTLEEQEKLWRVRDREVKEEEARHSERRAGGNHEPHSDLVPTPELCSNANANPSTCSSPNPSISPNFSNTNLLPFGAAHPFPLIAMQYPYLHVQYAPMANGFGFPCLMPCWAPMMSSVPGGPNPASNVFQPVACRTFQPFWAPDVEPTSGASPLSGKRADSSGENGRTIKRALSRTGTLGSGSSLAISDYQSNSLQASGSSGTDHIRSHSSRATAEISHSQLPPQANNLVQGQSEGSISSPHVQPQVDAVLLEAPSETERPSSNSVESAAKGDYSDQSQCASAKVDGVATVDESAPAADESTRRPPLPAPLPRMPCVSTTGNGPNGRTVEGFLYRYTSTQVCIVCVCHGSSFSAAEFVEHAGGTDIDNPLRHIVVAPS